MNKGDTSNLAAVFTDDAIVVGGPLCTIRTPCKGLADVAKRVQGSAAVHDQQSLAGAPAVVGNAVQWRYETRNDTAKGAGVDRQIIMNQATLRGDKIALAVGFPDLSDAQTAKSQVYAQQRATASASAKPAASGASDPATVVTRWNDAINKGDASAQRRCGLRMRLWARVAHRALRSPHAREAPFWLAFRAK